MVLIAWGFGSAGMLGWLAAALIPVMLHLWHQSRRKETAWGAMFFLRQALERHSRRMRITQWLLLLLRVSLIMAVVFAFARPFLDSRLGANGTSPTSLRLVVLDTSHSMGLDSSVMERGREAAQRLVTSAPPGTGILFTTPFTKHSTDAEAVSFGDHAAVLREIERAEATPRSIHFADYLPRLGEFVDQLLASHDGLQQLDVFVISDFAASSWYAPHQDSSDGKFSWQDSIDEEERVRMHVVNVGTTGLSNVAVTRVWTPDRRQHATQPLHIFAEITNFGATLQKNLAVRFYVDDQRVHDEVVQLDAGQRQVVEYMSPGTALGWHAVEVRLGEEPHEADDRRWLVLDAAARTRVLCVDASFRLGRSMGNYLSLALSPGTNSQAAESPFVVDIARGWEMPDTTWREYDAVVFCDMPSFTAAESEELARYLREGGSILWVMGPRTDPANYHETLGANGADILPVELDSTPLEGVYSLDPLDFEHPMWQDFRGQEETGLNTPAVYRYWKSDRRTEEANVAALVAPDGDPLLVTRPIARGRSAILTTSLDLPSQTAGDDAQRWSTVAVMPYFVPLMHGLLGWMTAHAPENLDLLVGESWPLPVSDLVETDVTVRLPDGNEVTTSMANDSVEYFTDTDIPGVYQFTTRQPSESTWFAVNVSPEESDPATTSPQILPEAWTYHQVGDLDSWLEQFAFSSDQSELSRALLWLAAGLLLAEGWLLWFAAPKSGFTGRDVTRNLGDFNTRRMAE